MRKGILLALALVLAARAPPVRADTGPGAGWSFTASVWGGVSRYDVLGLEHGVGVVGSEDGEDLLRGRFNAMGAQAVLRLRFLDLGALYEGTLLDRTARSEVVTPLVGFAVNLGRSFRLDVLGELGGHKVTQIGRGNALATETKAVWLPSFGVRPGLSAFVPLGPTRLVLSATPFARWDLVKRTVSVATSSGTGERTYYEAGGATYGLVCGVGIEI